MACRRLTAGSLVKPEEAADDTDTSGQSQGLGETTLSDVRRGESLEGNQGNGRKGGGGSAIDVVASSGISNNSLEVTAEG